MGDKSAIEWTDATWNPTVGCYQVSPGCGHCYAKKLHDKRHKAFLDGKAMAPQYAQPFEVLQLLESRLDVPLRTRKPTMFFVNSVSDLFHEDVPDAFIDKVFAVMALARQHTFQILTKRAERMRDYVGFQFRRVNLNQLVSRSIGRRAHFKSIDTWPLPNVWLGVSVENQPMADRRIPLLLQTPAAIRFISAEPLLAATNLHLTEGFCRACLNFTPGTITGHCFDPKSPCFAGEMAVGDGIDWVITGGESGPRPMHPDWARSLRDQCAAAGVAFFFKQHGSWVPFYDRDVDDPDWQHVPKESARVTRMNVAGGCGFHGERLIYFRRTSKQAAGRLLDGVEHNAFPEVSTR